MNRMLVIQFFILSLHVQAHSPSMEKLLHYVWKHHILPLSPLFTTDGQTIEIIDAGLHNRNAGPDFFNAKIRINGTLWVGNVELHLRSSDWQRHGHQTDPAYNSVILHVAEDVDAEVVTADGRRPPQLQLPIPATVRANYARLCQSDDYPRCWPVIPQIPLLTVHSWMSALLAERLQERSQRCLDYLTAVNGDWERTLFITLARNFGFGINGDAFERWAKQFPLQAAYKHRDDLFQLSALFLGTAGLLESRAIPLSKQDETLNEEKLSRLLREWAYLSHKFQLTPSVEPSLWRYHRLRPQNFPHQRLLQLAQLFQHQTIGLSALLSMSTHEAFHTAFSVCQPALSASTCDLLIINTVCPILFAYGATHGDEALQERAILLLEQLKPENNYIIRQWQQCGLCVENAADSQSLIQLKRVYCDRHDCLRCRFGYEYLKSEK